MFFSQIVAAATIFNHPIGFLLLGLAHLHQPRAEQPSSTLVNRRAANPASHGTPTAPRLGLLVGPRPGEAGVNRAKPTGSTRALGDLRAVPRHGGRPPGVRGARPVQSLQRRPHIGHRRSAVDAACSGGRPAVSAAPPRGGGGRAAGLYDYGWTRRYAPLTPREKQKEAERARERQRERQRETERQRDRERRSVSRDTERHGES